MLRAAALSLLVLFQAGQAAAPAQTDIQKALDQLQGTWVAVSLNGQALPEGAQMSLVFTGDKYENWVNGSVDERGSVKLDPSTKPTSIDFLIAEGQDAGQIQLGLMVVSGETLTLAFATPGNRTRPKTQADAALLAILKKKP